MNFEEQILQQADKLEERKSQLLKKKFEQGLSLEERDELNSLEEEQVEVRYLISELFE